MNNVTQTQPDTKTDLLQKQLEKTLAIYKAASRSERKAAVENIDYFLMTLKPMVSKDQKIFWLRVREKLERMNEVAPPMHPDVFKTLYLGEDSTIFPQ